MEQYCSMIQLNKIVFIFRYIQRNLEGCSLKVNSVGAGRDDPQIFLKGCWGSNPGP